MTVHGYSSAMLLDRDYYWCARLMLEQYGQRALGRAERRAQEMLADGNSDTSEIWMRVAAAVRQIQSNAQAA
jgi:hypothetical protein